MNVVKQTQIENIALAIVKSPVGRAIFEETPSITNPDRPASEMTDPEEFARKVFRFAEALVAEAERRAGETSKGEP